MNWPNDHQIVYFCATNVPERIGITKLDCWRWLLSDYS